MFQIDVLHFYSIYYVKLCFIRSSAQSFFHRNFIFLLINKCIAFVIMKN